MDLSQMIAMDGRQGSFMIQNENKLSDPTNRPATTKLQL